MLRGPTRPLTTASEAPQPGVSGPELAPEGFRLGLTQRHRGQALVACAFAPQAGTQQREARPRETQPRHIRERPDLGPGSATGGARDRDVCQVWPSLELIPPARGQLSGQPPLDGGERTVGVVKGDGQHARAALREHAGRGQGQQRRWVKPEPRRRPARSRRYRRRVGHRGSRASRAAPRAPPAARRRRRRRRTRASRAERPGSDREARALRTAALTRPSRLARRRGSRPSTQTRRGGALSRSRRAAAGAACAWPPSPSGHGHRCANRAAACGG